MQGHYKASWVGAGMRLCFAALLLDTLLLLWGYQVGQWLRRAVLDPQREGR